MQASKTLKHGHLNDRTEQGRGSDTVQYCTVPLGCCAFFCLFAHQRPPNNRPSRPIPDPSAKTLCVIADCVALTLAVMPAAARVRDACTRASCESSCRWAKKATGAARSLADWIGLGRVVEQEVARLGRPVRRAGWRG